MKRIAIQHDGSALRRSFAAVAFILLTAGVGFAQPVSFEKSKNFTVGANPVFVVTGDFNEDGEIDLAVVNNASEKVAILLGDGDPATLGFTKPPPLPVGNSPLGAAVGDFNNDGHLDLAIANFRGDTVSIRLGIGDGTFTSVLPNLSPGNGPIFIAIGHFNGDSNLDMAVANHTSGNVAILLGNGDGTFTEASGSPITVGNQPVSIAVADFSSPPDGNLDLAITNFAGKTVSILLGDGSGNFTPSDCRTDESTCNVSGQPVSIVTGDFNGDGLPDLATANELGKNVNVLLRNPDVDVLVKGLFAEARRFSLGDGVPVSLTTADFNGDGALDLAAAHFPDNRLSVLLGNGDGTFGHRKSFSTAGGQFAITTDDFDGDTKPDLAVANGKLSILLNDTEFPGPTPSITVISPDGGESWPIGTSQTITWSSNDITTIKNHNVQIYLSRDSGATWKSIIKSTPNDGSQIWKVKGPAKTTVRIKVCSVNFPAICDTSDADFTIN
jgi:hypothetical protein